MPNPSQEGCLMGTPILSLFPYPEVHFERKAREGAGKGGEREIK